MKKTPILIILVSLVTLLVTFVSSNMALSFEKKAILFGVSVVIEVFAIFFYFKSQSRFSQIESESNAKSKLFSNELDEKLALLDEVDDVFGGSLNSADMFRLITSRINDIIPFTTCSLSILDDSKGQFKVVNSVGENADKLFGFTQPCGAGLTGKAFANRKATIDERNELDKAILSYQFLKTVGSSLAIPLFNNNKVYGILCLYHSKQKVYGNNSILLAEAVSSHISETLQRSINNELSVKTALTDSLTNLPNERGFYMLLEQQIAEAQRFMERRPLTILAIDLQNFSEINKKYGHIQGDQVLMFVAKLVRNQLRQMDILARIISDEFFIILPTASEETTNQVVQRLYYTISNTPYVFADQTKVLIKLNFSAATFMKDGDSAEELVKSALKKKEIEKLDQPSTVVKFPDRFKQNAS